MAAQGLFADEHEQQHAPHEGRFVRLAPERGVDHPDGLTYALPASLDTLAVGDRVEAPLGRGNTPVAGYIIEILTQTTIDPARLKPLRRRLSGGLPPALVELARWMARYYVCPIGMVFASMTPAAVKHDIGVVSRAALEPTPDHAAALKRSRSPRCVR